MAGPEQPARRYDPDFPPGHPDSFIDPLWVDVAEGLAQFYDEEPPIKPGDQQD